MFSSSYNLSKKNVPQNN